MTFIRSIATAILAAAHAIAAAQSLPSPAEPSNPVAAAVPLSYVSAFTHYQRMGDDAESPDKIWRSANDEVGQAGDHAAQIKTPAARATAPAPMPPGMNHQEKIK